jgi:hypothetical protein
MLMARMGADPAAPSPSEREDAMETDQLLREHLAQLLMHSHAHMSFEDAVAEYPVEHINMPFPNGTYGAWHLLEHMRLTQLDILDFIRNPDYQEKVWPRDYWRRTDEQGTADDWERTIHAFLADREALRDIIMNPQADLWAPIPQGTGQTIAREIMVVADHNAYHTGEFAIMRQVMGTWGVGHDKDG